MPKINFITAALFYAIPIFCSQDTNKTMATIEVGKFVERSMQNITQQIEHLRLLDRAILNCLTTPSPISETLDKIKIKCNSLEKDFHIRELQTLDHFLKLMREEPLSWHNLTQMLKQRKLFIKHCTQELTIENELRENISKFKLMATTNSQEAALKNLNPVLQPLEQDLNKISASFTETKKLIQSLQADRNQLCEAIKKKDLSSYKHCENRDNDPTLPILKGKCIEKPSLIQRLTHTATFLDNYFQDLQSVTQQLRDKQSEILDLKQALTLTEEIVEIINKVRHRIAELLKIVVNSEKTDLQRLWYETDDTRKFLVALNEKNTALLELFKQLEGRLPNSQNYKDIIEANISKDNALQRSIEFEYQHIKALTLLREIEEECKSHKDYVPSHSVLSYVRVPELLPEEEVTDSINANRDIAFQLIGAISKNSPVGKIFAGKPGIGKTFLPQAIAQFLCLPCFVIDIPLLLNEYKSSIDAGIARVLNPITQSGLKSIIVLDEIDTSEQNNHQINQTENNIKNNSGRALCAMINQNKLATTAYIGTTNDQDKLSSTLKDRLRIYEFPELTKDQRKKALATYFKRIKYRHPKATVHPDCLSEDYLNQLANASKHFSYRCLQYIIDGAVEQANNAIPAESPETLMQAYANHNKILPLLDSEVTIIRPQLDASFKEILSFVKSEGWKEWRHNVGTGFDKSMHYIIPTVQLMGGLVGIGTNIAATTLAYQQFNWTKQSHEHDRSFAGQLELMVNNPKTWISILSKGVFGIIAVGGTFVIIRRYPNLSIKIFSWIVGKQAVFAKVVSTAGKK